MNSRPGLVPCVIVRVRFGWCPVFEGTQPCRCQGQTLNWFRVYLDQFGVWLQSPLCVVLVLPVGGDRHKVIASLQLSATDVSARTTMKGAAKCDKHCDLQNSVNQQGFERILRFWDIPESMPASESTLVSCRQRVPPLLIVELAVLGARICAPMCLVPLMHEVYLACGGEQLAERICAHCLLTCCLQCLHPFLGSLSLLAVVLT